MVYLIGALLIAWLARDFLRRIARADPGLSAALVTQASGMAALVAAAVLLGTGRIALGIGMALLGFWCLGAASWLPRAQGLWPRRSQTGVSRMRSAMIEMEYDHATQKLRGTVLAGEFEGRALDELTRQQCFSLHASAVFQDGGGARLLEAYLDRRFPGWRAARQGDGNARGPRREMRASGAMTQEEAYDVLGLRHGAPRPDIVRAHRSLMKRWHPDHGGSNDVAARVNEAKEVLLRLHH